MLPAGNLENEVERLYKQADPDISVKVRMINIIYGRNMELLQYCKPLEEYTWFVARVRENNAPDENGDRIGLEKAVDMDIDEIPDDYEIKKYLIDNKAKVRNMCLTEYNEKETMEQFREEGREDARLSDVKK